jgi:iron complex transport system substrate-binding protein
MRVRLLALFALTVIAACGGGGGEAAPTTSTTTERIVPVNGDLAEVVYALGLGDQVVATDISATYPAAAQQTPKIGYQPTLVAETILAHDPTVVLADDNAGPAEVLQQLNAAGVRVVRFPKEETIDAPARKVRDVAAALGVPDRGEEVVATLDAQLADAERRAEAGTDMGVVDNAELSVESIVEEAPDVLLVTTTGLESVGGIDALLATPGIDRTPAAANRRVVAFEDQYLYGLGPRTGELVTAFHPDAPTP